MFEHLNKEVLVEIDHHDIRSWVISILEDEGLKSRTVNRRLSCLRSFFRYLMRVGMVDMNPMDKVASLKTKKSLPLFLEQQQMEQLLNNIDFGEGFSGIRDRLLIEILYTTGMRRAEVIGLSLSSIDLYNMRIKVLGKRNKERIIPFTDQLSVLLRGYLELRPNIEHGAHGFLLVRDNGSQMTDGFVYQKVNKYLRLVTTVGKKSPHLLRHTFATHMLNNGADINAIKELLGHASLSATQVYTHNTIDKLTRIHKQAHPRA